MTSCYRPIYDPWNLPREEGGWCCGQCGYLLEQKDTTGVYTGVLFHVKGYRCPQCGHHHGTGKSYDWRLMPIPTIHGSHAGSA
jgi:hypothetical protein